MAEITRKRVGELVQKTFAILMEHPEGLQAKDVLASLEKSTILSEFEQSDYPNHPGDLPPENSTNRNWSSLVI